MNAKEKLVEYIAQLATDLANKWHISQTEAVKLIFWEIDRAGLFNTKHKTVEEVSA